MKKSLIAPTRRYQTGHESLSYDRNALLMIILLAWLVCLPKFATASGAFAPQDTISDASAYVVAVADVDGDTDDDIIAALDLKTKIVWFENDGSGNFSSAKTIADLVSNVQFIHIVDIDGDTDPDILAALYGRYNGETGSYTENGRILLFTNTGGSFTATTIDSECNGAKGVYADDLDDDNDLDIISAAANPGKVTWYRNIGGNFTEMDSIDFPGAACVITADIDGRNGIDIVASSGSKDEIVWFQNDGDSIPTFTKVYGAADAPYKDACDEDVIPKPGKYSISQDAPGSDSILTLDLDDDGKPDIISASGGTGVRQAGYYLKDPAIYTIVEKQYDGQNNLISCEIIPPPYNSTDGKGGGDNIEWFQNTVTSATTEWPDKKIINPNAYGTTCVRSARINGDQLPDLVYTSKTGTGTKTGKIYYSPGKGPGVDPGPWQEPYNPFGQAILITDKAEAVRSIAVGDFDKDGDTDLVSASYKLTELNNPSTVYNEGKIQWFKNVNGFIISEVSTNTSEDGNEPVKFTIRADKVPESTVTLPISSSDTTEGNVSPESLEFTSENWTQERTVTVFGVNDNEVDGDQEYSIKIGPAISDDVNYNGSDPEDIQLMNRDDDSPFDPGGGSGTYGAGGSAHSCFLDALKN